MKNAVKRQWEFEKNYPPTFQRLNINSCIVLGNELALFEIWNKGNICNLMGGLS
jgi:hypothetical protein